MRVNYLELAVQADFPLNKMNCIPLFGDISICSAEARYFYDTLINIWTQTYSFPLTHLSGLQAGKPQSIPHQYVGYKGLAISAQVWDNSDHLF